MLFGTLIRSYSNNCEKVGKNLTLKFPYFHSQNSPVSNLSYRVASNTSCSVFFICLWAKLHHGSLNLFRYNYSNSSTPLRHGILLPVRSYFVNTTVANTIINLKLDTVLIKITKNVFHVFDVKQWK